MVFCHITTLRSIDNVRCSVVKLHIIRKKVARLRLYKIRVRKYYVENKVQLET